MSAGHFVLPQLLGRPHAEIEFSCPQRYPELLELIKAHGYDLERRANRMMSADEVAADRYDNTYILSVRALRQEQVPHAYSYKRDATCLGQEMGSRLATLILARVYTCNMQVTAVKTRDGPILLTDGRVVWLRRLRPDDAPRLIELRARLSPETVRRRFLRARPNCDPREAEALAAVDQVRRVAFAAVPRGGADGPIVAVGRYHVDRGGRADLALVVEDAYQHVGLGRVLLSRLIADARRQGLEIFDGHVLIDNRPVLQLLRGSHQPLEVHYAGGGDVLEIHLDISSAATIAAPTNPAERLARSS